MPEGKGPEELDECRGAFARGDKRKGLRERPWHRPRDQGPPRFPKQDALGYSSPAERVPATNQRIAFRSSLASFLCLACKSLADVTGIEEQCQLELFCCGLDAAMPFGSFHQQLARPPPGIAFLIVMRESQNEPGGISKAVKLGAVLQTDRPRQRRRPASAWRDRRARRRLGPLSHVSPTASRSEILPNPSE
jgi:hypothetical protein